MDKLTYEEALEMAWGMKQFKIKIANCIKKKQQQSWRPVKFKPGETTRRRPTKLPTVIGNVTNAKDLNIIKIRAQLETPNAINVIRGYWARVCRNKDHKKKIVTSKRSPSKMQK